MLENVAVKYKKKAAQYVDPIAQSKNAIEYHHQLEQLKRINPSAAEYIKGIDPVVFFLCICTARTI
jgi:hypothetical protein